MPAAPSLSGPSGVDVARTDEWGRRNVRGWLAWALTESPELELILVLPHGAERPDLPKDAVDYALRARPLRGLGRMTRDILLVRRWSRRSGADVVVSPHEWAPFGGGAPLVNIVQNVLHLDAAGRRARPAKSFVMRTIVRLTASRATKTIAVSPSAARTWQATTGRSAVVLPEGISPAFAQACRIEREDRWSSLSLGTHRIESPRGPPPRSGHRDG